MPSIFPTARSLFELFHNESACIEFLKERGAFDIPERCIRCEGNISIYGHVWKCKVSGCRKQESFLKTSFFGQSRLPVNQVMEIGYYWLAKCNYESILKITGHSSITISNYTRFFREHVARCLDPDDTLIGGNGVKVFVDESKFGRRKYNRGHSVNGVWVIGGVDDSIDRKMFAVIIDRRDRESIIDVLSRHVLPGSILITDCWRGYIGVGEILQTTHLTVNHSIGFVNNENGACTNAIEGTWAGLKVRINKRGGTAEFIGDHPLEYIWRRKNVDDLWNALIHSFSVLSY